MLNSVVGILWAKCCLPTNLSTGFDGDCCVILILPSLNTHVTFFRKLISDFGHSEMQSIVIIYSNKKEF
jgi:hypothetical protein